MTPQFSLRGTITEAQHHVLRYIALGHSHKEISSILGIEESAVESRIRDVRLKFPGINPIHLPLLAYREGVIGWDELWGKLPPFRGKKRTGSKVKECV